MISEIRFYQHLMHCCVMEVLLLSRRPLKGRFLMDKIPMTGKKQDLEKE